MTATTDILREPAGLRLIRYGEQSEDNRQRRTGLVLGGTKSFEDQISLREYAP